MILKLGYEEMAKPFSCRRSHRPLIFDSFIIDRVYKIFSAIVRLSLL